MKCDLDAFTTYYLRGQLAGRGLSPEDAASIRVMPCEGGALESLASVRCTDKYGGDREVRRIEDQGDLNDLVNDPKELDNLATAVKGVRDQ